MAETEQTPLRCPVCGSRRVRLSARQSQRRPVEIYRCTKCNRHFEEAATHTARPFTLGGIVVGVLVLIAVAAILAVTMRGGENHSTANADLPAAIDPDSTAPEASNDKVSQYQRGLHFWMRGNYQEAFPWLKSAADMGHREASYLLGLAYLYGRATVQNYRLAFERIQASASRNYLDAQHQLGIMYRDNVGVEKDREQAYIWLNIAASRGHEVATQDRDKLAAGMSAEEIARAQDGTMKELAKLRSTAAAKIAEIPGAATP